MIYRDLSNGFILAEILTRYTPELVEDDKVFNIYNFHNGYSDTQKHHNWEYLSKILRHKKLLKKFGPFELTEKDYYPVIS